MTREAHLPMYRCFSLIGYLQSLCRLTDSTVGGVGESGLHLAIVNNDVAMVRRLVTCGANVNQRASGRFFLPEDQKQQRNGVTDYRGLFT